MLTALAAALPSPPSATRSVRRTTPCRAGSSAAPRRLRPHAPPCPLDRPAARRGAAAAAAGREQESEAECEETELVAVTFVVNLKILDGQRVLLTGSTPQLGAWDVAGAVRLRWTPGDVWQATVQLPAGAAIEYKLALHIPHHRPLWERGGNRCLSVDPAPAILTCTWDQPHATTCVPHTADAARAAGVVAAAAAAAGEDAVVGLGQEAGAAEPAEAAAQHSTASSSIVQEQQQEEEDSSVAAVASFMRTSDRSAAEAVLAAAAAAGAAVARLMLNVAAEQAAAEAKHAQQATAAAAEAAAASAAAAVAGAAAAPANGRVSRGRAANGRAVRGRVANGVTTAHGKAVTAAALHVGAAARVQQAVPELATGGGSSGGGSGPAASGGAFQAAGVDAFVPEAPYSPEQLDFWKRKLDAIQAQPAAVKPARASGMLPASRSPPPSSLPASTSPPSSGKGPRYTPDQLAFLLRKSGCQVEPAAATAAAKPAAAAAMPAATKPAQSAAVSRGGGPAALSGADAAQYTPEQLEFLRRKGVAPQVGATASSTASTGGGSGSGSAAAAAAARYSPEQLAFLRRAGKA